MAPTRTPHLAIQNSATQHMPFRGGNLAVPMRGELPINTSMRVRNASFSGGTNGALGAGDRGIGQYVPDFTSNPYDSQDYVFRWRQYVHLYELSWEARKIVRIPIEDALRKPWEAQDIPEQMAEAIYNKLDQLGFMQVLKRSLMLERLLGGCLTFLGLEGLVDDPAKKYHPSNGDRLKFCNAIPISRISRVSWDTNPLSEGYMRPDTFLVNGQELHVSRSLVWDGEPLFDPYDFALTNFRSNLAGFGPSKLAPIWDDIIKAVGTRQAAYQLIQVNNAILIAVNDLQDLGSTNPGQANLNALKDVANQLSVYRAAMIDKEKATITQSAASFGSVPELIITFIQILSAASDIPATRFLGQAPGGLNATGESDLENYYNVIDAFQQQRIAPALKRVYDIVGFQLYPRLWAKERVKLNFHFPPLWNASELEQAQTASAEIDNVLKLHEQGLITPEKVIEELNSKGALSVKLDEIDLANLEDMQDEQKEMMEAQQVDPDEQIARLKGESSTGGKFGGQPTGIKQPSEKKPEAAIQNTFHSEFLSGMKDEQEHLEEVDGDQNKIAQIVLDHLKDDPQYYSKLRAAGLMKIDTHSKTVKGDELAEFFANSDGIKASWQSKSGKWSCQVVESAHGTYHIKGDGIPNSMLRRGATLEQAIQEAEKRVASHNSTTQGAGLMVRNQLPLEVLPTPTQAQIDAGNYRKHHLRLHGMDIAVENPRGSIRQGVDPNGVAWESTLPAHYGYIKRTEGADGDHVDCYIGDTEDSELVFVIDQIDLESGVFDEHKCILGCLSEREALSLYKEGFSDNKGKERIGSVTPMHLSQFKQWLSEADTTQPFQNEEFDESKHKRATDGKFGSGGSKKATSKKSEATVEHTEADTQAHAVAKERGLKIAPSWTDLWVNPDPAADLQVRCRDGKGNTQRIYSVNHHTKQAAEKFARLRAFTKDYPKMMNQIDKDMATSEEAKALYLIAQTGFRVGGEKDTGADEQAYGATTLTSDHIRVDGNTVTFGFTGKHGKAQLHEIEDPKLAGIFTGKEGRIINTNETKVLKYLNSLGGSQHYKVKDFRTFVATSVACEEVAKMDPPKDLKSFAKAVTAVCKTVSQKLGNSIKMAKDSYIDPTVFKAWETDLQGAK